MALLNKMPIRRHCCRCVKSTPFLFVVAVFLLFPCRNALERLYACYEGRERRWYKAMARDVVTNNTERAKAAKVYEALTNRQPNTGSVV